MRCLMNWLLSGIIGLGLISCRASFEDVQKQHLVSSGDDLGVKEDNAEGVPADEAPILENTKKLPPEESAGYDCAGTVVIHEKGRDHNRDGVLQPTEVTEITTECKVPSNDPTAPTGGGKVPPMPPKPKDCPNQSDPKGKCPDQPGQNIPGQSAGK